MSNSSQKETETIAALANDYLDLWEKAWQDMAKLPSSLPFSSPFMSNSSPFGAAPMAGGGFAPEMMQQSSNPLWPGLSPGWLQSFSSFPPLQNWQNMMAASFPYSQKDSNHDASAFTSFTSKTAQPAASADASDTSHDLLQQFMDYLAAINERLAFLEGRDETGDGKSSEKPSGKSEK